MSIKKLLFSSGNSDIVADPFEFINKTNVELNTSYTSDIVTVTGFSPFADIIITSTGGTIDAGSDSLSGIFDSSKIVNSNSNGTIVLAAKGTSSGSYTTNIEVIVSIGNVNSTFTIATRAIDTTPNSFSFTSESNANLSTQYTSTYTPIGYETSTSWSVSGSGTPQCSVAGGAYNTSGTISPGQSITVRMSSSNSYSSSNSCTVTIGGVSGSFSILTRSQPTEAVFTSGISSFTVPEGITSICVLCVGAGTPGYGASGSPMAGIGGGVSYANNIPVTPGQTYTIQAGNGYINYGNYALWMYSLFDGKMNGSGYDIINTTGKTIIGGYSNPSEYFAFKCTSNITATSYNGGSAGSPYSVSGGGGCAGYSGNGGIGGTMNLQTEVYATSGSGGGGGGGGRSGGNPNTGWTSGGGGGGGIGLYGIGSSGAAASSPSSGGGGGSSGSNGSFGSSGAGGSGGNYGGGGGSPANGSAGTIPGGSGAVRIIWGAGRSFPNNAA